MATDETIPFKFNPIERKTIVTEITKNLLDYLLSGQVKPGDKIPTERSLSEALGVGRSSLREALKALTVLGLLEVRQGDGTYLKRADSDLLPQVIEWGLLLGEKQTLHLIEAREKIELMLAGMAAERRQENEVLELKQILERMRNSTGNSKEFVEADVAFHLKLAEMANNTVLRDILSSIQALLRAWIRSVIEAAGNAQFSYDEHLPIYLAVEKGDAQAAVEAMASHMNSASSRLKLNLAAAGNESLN
ncbi:FadR/GntR family transcriptional regulator [Paenibacillus thalictri]|uniref:FadR family transcriptional regulator n=1 Tax=Paenibacillus thalictri TaxID=2527873 RepID=A0A4Q9DEU8_9BACL|nr:FadR/GntR family transcriptional regulator [Paenibacillus thalictri]TBL70292.1 FadR family transcriptional regulator [Paenibacillus thalictri]